MNMQPNGILAFDLATQTGWAYAEPEYYNTFKRYKPYVEGQEGKLYSGTFSAKSMTSRERKFAVLMHRMDAMIDRLSPSLVVFESPLVRNFETARFTYGLAAILEAICGDGSIPIHEIHVSKVKSAGSGGGCAVTKEFLFTYARMLGWRPDSLDASDALWLLEATMIKLKE